MMTLATLIGGTYGTADDSLQFSSPTTSVQIPGDLANLNVPAVTDGQCVYGMVSYRNWSTQTLYVGDASVGHPVQISVGGVVTIVTAPGTVSLSFPPGEYLVKFTRDLGAILVSGIAFDAVSSRLSSLSPTSTSIGIP